MATLSGPLSPTSEAIALMYFGGVRSYRRFRADRFDGMSSSGSRGDGSAAIGMAIESVSA